MPPSVILTLPTGHYIAGAAVTVAMTGILGAMAHRMPAPRAVEVLERRALVSQGLSSWVGFAGFLGLLGVGFWGATDPMHNLMTLVFWTGVWIALPLASMLLGDLWRPINPWTGPVRVLRLALGWRGSVGLARLGHWPAVCGYAGFVWFQMISLSPDDPATLARVAGFYWLLVLALAVAEGEDWLDRGEFLSVLFGMIAKVSPLWREQRGARVRLMAGWPGTQVLMMPPLSRSAMVFVSLALAALTFDGLVETFWWQGLIGQNPLEPMGRSVVQGENTAGLLAVWALTGGMLWAGIVLGRWLSGQAFRAGPVMLSFLAIASGYHAAHYLVMLMTAGQYTLAALNDPFFRGDSWLGLPPFYVSFGFLTDPQVMPLIYGAQFAAILGAHLLAVVLVLQLTGPVRAIAHLPMTGLMVGYTVLGLWLLSTARTG